MNSPWRRQKDRFCLGTGKYVFSKCLDLCLIYHRPLQIYGQGSQMYDEIKTRKQLHSFSMNDLSRTQNRIYSANLLENQRSQKIEKKTPKYLELVIEDYEYGPESSVDDMDDDEVDIKIRRTSSDSDQDSGAFSCSPSPDYTTPDLLSPDLVMMASKELNTVHHNCTSKQDISCTGDQNIARVNSELLLSCLHEAGRTSVFTSYPSSGGGGDRRHSLLVSGINQRYHSIWQSQVTVNGHHVCQF